MKRICLAATSVILVAVVAFLLFADREKPITETEVAVSTITETGVAVSKKKRIEVAGVCQYPELPTGCESAAAVTVLQYYGVEITAAEFAKTWLTCSQDFYMAEGELYGPDPNEVFAGDPFSENAYGCFADPIVKAINDNSLDLAALKITDKTLSELCTEYIDHDEPLLVWATMGMEASKKGKSWRIPNGTTFTWPAGEHALVLVGYDEEYYFFMDPQSGSTVGYQRHIAQQRFEEMGRQAVYIHRK